MIFLTHILEINRELGLREYPVQGQEKVVEMWKEREEHRKSGQQIGSSTAGKTVIPFGLPLFRPSFLCSFLTASRQRSGMSARASMGTGSDASSGGDTSSGEWARGWGAVAFSIRTARKLDVDGGSI